MSLSPDALAPCLIVDTSPLIGLAKTGLTDLLTIYDCPVLLPETVVREVEAGPEDDPARLALGLTRLQLVPDVPTPAALAGRVLDAGERAVLALGLTRPNSLLVLDDTAGRRAAQSLALTFTGTVGIVLQARRTGHLPALAPVLHALRDAGLYLPSDEQLRSLLAPFGESWP